MNKIIFSAAPAIAIILLTACSEFQYYSSTGGTPVTSKGYGADYRLTQLHETRAMTPEQRVVTYELWEQEYLNNPDTSNRLTLALLLATGNDSIRDLPRALKLLEGIYPEPDDASDRELAILLKQYIHEQLHADTTTKDLKALIRKKNKLIKELEQQQQALTNIEQNIQQRENQPEAGNGKQ